MQTALDKFLDSYIETALWSSTDDNGKPLDSIDADLADETIEKMRRDCEKFMTEADAILNLLSRQPIAHDFWLTRNRHGAGFWDGDYPKEIGIALTKLAHSYGECDLYIGDDGKIYIS